MTHSFRKASPDQNWPFFKESGLWGVKGAGVYGLEEVTDVAAGHSSHPAIRANFRVKHPPLSPPNYMTDSRETCSDKENKGEVPDTLTPCLCCIKSNLPDCGIKPGQRGAPPERMGLRESWVRPTKRGQRSGILGMVSGDSPGTRRPEGRGM